jgi:hypothetical protein
MREWEVDEAGEELKLISHNVFSLLLILKLHFLSSDEIRREEFIEPWLALSQKSTH